MDMQDVGVLVLLFCLFLTHKYTVYLQRHPLEHTHAHESARLSKGYDTATYFVHF